MTKSGICCHPGNAKATWTETACGRQSLKLCESLGCSTGPLQCATPLRSTALGKDTQSHNGLWSFLPILLIVTNTIKGTLREECFWIQQTLQANKKVQRIREAQSVIQG